MSSLLEMAAPSSLFSVPGAHRSPVPRPRPLKLSCKVSELDVTTTHKLPPGPMRLPLIGNLHNLAGSLQPHEALAELAKTYGPIMHLQLGEVPNIIISSPSIAQEVMMTHDAIFAHKPENVAANIVTYGSKDIAFSPPNEYWKQMRKVCFSELLGLKTVESFSALRREEVSKLIESLRQSAGSPVNVTEKVSTVMNIIISKATFGNECKDQDAVVSLVKEVIASAGGFDLADLFPSWKLIHPISGLKSKVEKLHQRLDKLLDGIINEHKKKMLNTEGGQEEEILVDVLLRLQNSNSSLQCPIGSSNTKAVIWDMFAAGTDTSTTTLEWAMAEMMRTPRVMKKAQAEIRQAFNGKEFIAESDIKELTYFKSVIKESLRLHPPVPLLPRENKESSVIGGYFLPTRTKVIVNGWSIMRDSKYWIEAESFVPERFEDTDYDFKGSNHFEYIPFGAGRRICPGIVFGVTNVDVALANLLFHFDWKLPEGITPENLDMTEAFGGTLTRKDNLHLIATPYIPQEHGYANPHKETSNS